MTIARMGVFFKETRSLSSDESKTPDEECPVRSSARDAQTIGM